MTRAQAARVTGLAHLIYTTLTNFSGRSSGPRNSALIGSLSKDDGDVKENGNNAIGLD